MFKMFAVSGMNRIDPVVYHSGYEEIVKDRLGFRAMFFNKPGYRGDSLRRRGDDANIAAFIKSNKLFCLYWRQRVLDPSFVGNDSIKFHEVLDGNGSFYVAVYGLLNSGFANSMESRVLVIGIDKDVGINQTCGRGIHYRGSPCQAPVFLYVRDERSGSSGEGLSSLFFAGICFSFSDIRQSLLLHRFFLPADSLKYLLSFSVSQPVPLASLFIGIIRSIINSLHRLFYGVAMFLFCLQHSFYQFLASPFSVGKIVYKCPEFMQGCFRKDGEHFFNLVYFVNCSIHSGHGRL